MWLLDKMLSKLIKKGELIVTNHDGKEYRYGAPDPEHGPVHARLTSRKAAWHIAKDPRVGAGEAYMNGWLDDRSAERHSRPRPAHPLQCAVRESGRAEDQGTRSSAASTPSPASSTRSTGRAARAATPSIPTTSPGGSTSCSSTRTGNIPAPIIRDPGDSLEQAQLDKKAHIAARLNIKPGMKVLDIGCGWGGLALYLHRHYGVEVLGVALAPDQIEFCNERARELGVSDKVKFELKDYRDVTASSTGSPASA